MRILAFPGRFHARTKAPARDWSTQEIADFYRAHRLLAETGTGIGIDRGISDEGEPWMVFFDTASHEVFLHIARIDDVCHLVCDPFSLRLNAADIPSLIAQFEHSVRDQLSIRSDRAKNVVVHPAARIIMSISVVFLLFKLENGEAHAKGLSEKSGASGADGRGAEKSVSALARAQSAFARAFDAVDAPVHAAVLAGLILAGELALKPLLTANGSSEHEKLMALALIETGLVAAKADDAAPEAVVADAVAHIPLPSIEPNLAALTIPAPVLPDMQMLVQFTPAESVVLFANPGPPADFRTAQFVPVAVEAAALIKADQEMVLDKTDAAKALEFLASVSVGTASQAAVPLKGDKVVDISLSRLSDMEDAFGFAVELRLSLSDLYRLLEHYSSQMGGYEYEYKTGQVLIEQIGVDRLDESQLGILTNTLSDGSTYTIVGRADLIDDVLNFFV